MTPLQRLGANIRAERLRCGLTQHDMTEELGWDQSLFSSYENGKNHPGAIRVYEIACIFGAPETMMPRLFRGVN